MICIFDSYTRQDQFNTCGERILNPLSGYVYEELNGSYYYELTVPMLPEDDSWRYIVPRNIIRSSKGQLFPISKVTYSNQNGLPVVSAYAPHVWYYLSDKVVANAEINQFSCYWALDWLHKHTEWNYDPNFVDYNFTYHSDIDALQYMKFENTSLAYCILGSADSVVNKYGGELHRNNFEYSVNKRKQGAKDDAFSLVYGWNCTDVKSTIDYSDYITVLRFEDNVHESGWGIIKTSTGRVDPHHVGAVKRMSYKEEDPNLANLIADGEAYWAEHVNPKLNYEVTFTDLSGTSRSYGWGDLESLNVGDRGTVIDVRGVSDVNKIIATKYDDVRGRMESCKLGNFDYSFMYRGKWDKVLSKDNPESRRLNVLEEKTKYWRLIEDE